MQEQPVALWLLPFCCAIGFAVVYAVVSGLRDVYEVERGLARSAAEVGLAGGALYWLLVWLLPPSAVMGARGILAQLLLPGGDLERDVLALHDVEAGKGARGALLEIV